MMTLEEKEIINEVKMMETPQYVYIPMAQNYGHHCLPFVAVGDTVKVGQPIAYAEANIGAPIHSSVSGKVIKITEDADLNGVDDQVIVIEADGKQEMWEGIQRPKINTREEFLQMLNSCGMIGIEGECLATHVQLDEENVKNAHTLIVNGAEWTKYSDFEWEMARKDTKYIIEGIIAAMKFLDLKQCYIGIEEEAKRAIKALEKGIEDKGVEHMIQVVGLPQSCPPGSDRVLIFEAAGQILSANNLPEDFGFMVANLYSIAFLGFHIKTGFPLVRKVISVEGSAVKHPQNLMVPIGATISDIVEYCGGYSQEPKKIVLGGPAIARPVVHQDVPISKDNNAIIAFKEEEIPLREEISCKDCDSCKRVCPIHLVPDDLYEAFEAKDIHQLKELGLERCTECGRCAFVCPAAKPLSYMIEQAKILIS